MGCIYSAPRRGRANPYDNAEAEGFFKTLKDEEIYLLDVVSVEELAERLPYYIDEIYNEQRLHSSLGYLAPMEFEALHINSGPPAVRCINDRKFAQSDGFTPESNLEPNVVVIGTLGRIYALFPLQFLSTA